MLINELAYPDKMYWYTNRFPELLNNKQLTATYNWNTLSSKHILTNYLRLKPNRPAELTWVS